MSYDKTIWCHDLKAWVTEFDVKYLLVRCPYCGNVVNRYVESHYTGGEPCVSLTQYCRKCGHSLQEVRN